MHAMALIVETRDPYTADHQQRVTELAQALANEMGLSEDQREGVRVAAVVRDIGKLYVPAEFLASPDG